ncbi:MAG: hypothetical protein SO142_02925, partial [Prevotella sp.]|nr:hypothetical protein [Prevotella sp.]
NQGMNASVNGIVFSVIVTDVRFISMFIALKSMAAIASLRSATVGSERMWCQAFAFGVKNSFL